MPQQDHHSGSKPTTNMTVNETVRATTVSNEQDDDDLPTSIDELDKSDEVSTTL